MAAGLQSMCQYWKEFDLQDVQRGLDITATDIANRQDESDASRKRLVEQSRDFKKNTPEDIRKVVAPLLKSFQSEVDSLSKRSKAAEAAFLTVYKKIIDLPDPVTVLEHALQLQKKAQRVSDLEIENKQLRETLDEYNHEFAEVKNQEVTIKQLRDKLKEFEDKIEATAEARAKEKERELQRDFGEKERQLQETQLSVAKKLGEAEQKVTTLHSALENVQSELFEVKSKYDEATSARSDEMDMVMADLERANERAAAAEREVDHLKQQLSSATTSLEQTTENMQKAPDMDKTIDMLTRSSLEVELAAKEKEISQLVEDVQRLQASLNKLRESTASQVLKLEEELSEKNRAFKILEERIKTQEDYEEIKRELNIMKSVEFSSESCDEDAKSKSLEMLLLEKNKALQSANTQLKVSNNDISESSTPALSENAEAFATMLGEEIAISYQQNNSSSRMSTPSSTETTTESGKMSPPPRPIVERSQSVSSDQHLPPPPSPQFYPYGSGHMMSNFIGLGNYKTDPNNAQGLDTTLVAKTVRELLSIHNIGQRLFAKHVLGLSQGTVSELLSKPKTWDKLTEKGRESYRKMYSWATDERNILALKAISPKKGSQPLIPNVQREDAHTEERIAHILSEAQHAMQAKKAMEQVGYTQQQVAHAMVNSIYQQEMTRLAQVSGHQGLIPPSTNVISSPTISSTPNQLSRKHSQSEVVHHHKNNVENQVSAKDMVERIYRQELIKLAQAAESAGNIAACTMYQQELARLAQNVHKEDHEPGEILRSRSSPEGMSVKSEPRINVKSEPPDSTSDDVILQSNGPIDLSKHSSSSAPTTPTSVGSDKSPTDSAHHPGSAFFLVKPTKVNGHDGFENNRFPPFAPAECISPLQRMQNIANSLMSRPHMGVASAKPLKAVLPPITQEEFDKFSNVNTEDLVKKIKDTLSQYSISQRLFGESVLGLSQGSVSDLLARPKPWHMLTQKGREPFIRMQNFLEDAEAIPKLVASQYHISPDKLMRSASVGGSEQGCPPEWNVAAMNGPNNINVSPGDKLPSNHVPVPSSPAVPPDHPLHHHQFHHHHHHPATHHFNVNHHHQFNWASFSYPSSMLEVVAMTSEIDTLELTSRTKDVLQFHNLGQKLFGEAVLGLSQGSVSELLSKPKPWHMLSIKGREPFIKMHLWLSDPNNVERLKHYQNEVKAQRRRRSSLDERVYDSPSTPKRPRVFFTEEQKDKLRLAYNQDPYPNQNTIEALANDLNVGVKTVINWFHNHRMRAKQQQHAGNGGPGSGNGEMGNMAVKSEPTDDNSSHSDVSSMSGDVSHFHPGYHGNESNQWLFPQFEPMSLQKRLSSGDKGEEGDEEDEDDDEIGSQSSTCSKDRRSVDEMKNTEDDKKSSSETVFNDNNDDSGAEMSDEQSSLSSKALQNIPQPGVNKRKRSNPQYVSEGRHLDKTKNVSDDSLQSQISNDNDDDTEKENEEVNRDKRIRKDVICKIEKLQKGIETAGDDWDEFDRSVSIEKLQKNLQQSSEEDWEF